AIMVASSSQPALKLTRNSRTRSNDRLDDIPCVFDLQHVHAKLRRHDKLVGCTRGARASLRSQPGPPTCSQRRQKRQSEPCSLRAETGTTAGYTYFTAARLRL